MPKLWSDDAWEDYLWWQSQDKRTLKRINKLVEDAQRNPYEGLGQARETQGKLIGLVVKKDQRKGPSYLRCAGRHHSHLLS